jgi:16S rRNA (cytosine967-C5)-methyltransferase
VRPNSLATRVADQAAVLDRAAALVRPGGRIAYITCSVLPAESDEAVAALLARAPDFASIPPPNAAADANLAGLAEWVTPTGLGLQLSPLRTGTDGFYIALLRRAG